MAPPPRTPLVLHVLPLDLARGAQNYARFLRDELTSTRVRHETVSIFRSPARVLRPDVALEVRDDRLRRLGSSPVAAIRLRKLLHRRQPAVVVAHGSEPFRYCTIACPAASRLVYYRIGISTGALRRGPRRALYRLAMRRADFVAGVSDETLQDAIDTMGASPEICRLIPNGRDPSAFTPADPAIDPPRIIWVGQLTPGKRPDVFVELIRRLRARGCELEASLVGEGPMAETLLEPARRAEVEMLGRRDDVADLLSRSQVFCFTSGGESEGMPGVLIEAGLAGLPTVSTEVAGASTVIDQGLTGIVVPTGDTSALADAVESIVRDPGRRVAMGQEARERCIREFSLTASVRRWQDLLTEALDAPRRRGRVRRTAR